MYISIVKRLNDYKDLKEYLDDQESYYYKSMIKQFNISRRLNKYQYKRICDLWQLAHRRKLVQEKCNYETSK